MSWNLNRERLNAWITRTQRTIKDYVETEEETKKKKKSKVINKCTNIWRVQDFIMKFSISRL